MNRLRFLHRCAGAYRRSDTAVLREVEPRFEHGVFGNVVALLIEVRLAVLFADDGVADDKS